MRSSEARVRRLTRFCQPPLKDFRCEIAAPGRAHDSDEVMRPLIESMSGLAIFRVPQSQENLHHFE